MGIENENYNENRKVNPHGKRTLFEGAPCK